MVCKTVLKTRVITLRFSYVRYLGVGVGFFCIYVFPVLYFNPCSILFVFVLLFASVNAYLSLNKIIDNCKNYIRCYHIHVHPSTLPECRQGYQTYVCKSEEEISAELPFQAGILNLPKEIEPLAIFQSEAKLKYTLCYS